MTRDEIEKAIKDFEMPSDAYYSDFDSVNPKTLIAFAEHILRVAEAKRWQPIETAPRDGTKIWCFEKWKMENGHTYTEQFSATYSFLSNCWFDNSFQERLPNYWQEMPKEPEVKS